MSLLFVTIYEYIGEGEGAWQLAICQADVMKKSNPVSYTHLDVYKRQIYLLTSLETNSTMKVRTYITGLRHGLHSSAEMNRR